MPNQTKPEDYEVRIVPQHGSWRCAPDQTLLLSALQAGWRLPHSCRNGTCRACISQLIEGQIAYRIEWPGLSAEEKAAGQILPCVACPRSDVVIEAPAARPL